jgi:hypothetical protein
LNLNGIPDGYHIVAVSLQARRLRSKTSKKSAIAREHYGVVVLPLQLETVDAPALPRSNQIAATVFDKGRNDTHGE